MGPCEDRGGHRARGDPVGHRDSGLQAGDALETFDVDVERTKVGLDLLRQGQDAPEDDDPVGAEALQLLCCRVVQALAAGQQQGRLQHALGAARGQGIREVVITSQQDDNLIVLGERDLVILAGHGQARPGDGPVDVVVDDVHVDHGVGDLRDGDGHGRGVALGVLCVPCDVGEGVGAHEPLI